MERTSIAVVDDDAAIRRSLSSLLRSLGYGVRLYANAEAFLADGAPPPDCLLTDIQMPGMSGIELQRIMRSRMPSIPIIVITAFPEEGVRTRSLQAGARFFLSKPVEAATIETCLAEALGKHP